MAENIKNHKETLKTTIESILRENTGLTIGIMGMSVIQSEEGVEQFEVLLSEQFGEDVIALLPKTFEEFVVNYERMGIVRTQQ